MARNITIPISDDDISCSQGYIVRYKPSASIDWQTLNGLQQTTPVIVTSSPLVISYELYIYDVSDSTQYDIGITRQCCYGTLAAETLTVYSTGS
jgi:hypothetical protein